MLKDITNLIEDLSGYLKLGLNKSLLPWLEMGEDFTLPKYLEANRQAVAAIHPPKMKLQVVDVIRETASTKTFRFQRLDGALPPFRAGQYVNWFVEINGVRTSRPYSMSSAPGQHYFDLTVREKPGGFVSPYLLQKVEKGAEFMTSGAFGNFCYEPLIDGQDLLFIAGGSGITPLMSIIREQAAKNFPLNIQLIYGNRKPDDIIFRDELSQIAEKYDNFKPALIISEPPEGYEGLTGFLTGDLLKEQVANFDNKKVFICGPNLMYDLVLGELTKLGVPSYRIKRELYGPPDNIVNEPGWPEGIAADATFKVVVKGRKEFDAKAGEPLINSLERHGLVIPSKCRSGECGACRTKLLSGKVFMPQQTPMRESDRLFGYIHACVSYPITDIEIAVSG